jgi:hypothetical protein
MTDSAAFAGWKLRIVWGGSQQGFSFGGIKIQSVIFHIHPARTFSNQGFTNRIDV